MFVLHNAFHFARLNLKRGCAKVSEFYQRLKIA